MGTPDGNIEVTYAFQQFNFGAKMAKIPTIGFRYASGPFFGALTASDEFKQFKVHSLYKVNNDLKLAGAIEHGIKGSDKPKFSFGVLSAVAPLNTKLKFKINQDMMLSCSKKVELA